MGRAPSRQLQSSGKQDEKLKIEKINAEKIRKFIFEIPMSIEVIQSYPKNLKTKIIIATKTNAYSIVINFKLQRFIYSSYIYLNPKK